MSQFPPTEAPAGPLKPHRGAVVLVLGILSLIICFILGIIAWVMANGDLKEMDAGIMDPSGRSMTVAGKICGIISVILTLLGFGIWIVLVVLVGAAGLAGAAGAGGP